MLWPYCDVFAYFSQNFVAIAIRNIFLGLADHENLLLLVITSSLYLIEMHL